MFPWEPNVAFRLKLSKGKFLQKALKIEVTIFAYIYSFLNLTENSSLLVKQSAHPSVLNLIRLISKYLYHIKLVPAAKPLLGTTTLFLNIT